MPLSFQAAVLPGSDSRASRALAAAAVKLRWSKNARASLRCLSESLLDCAGNNDGVTGVVKNAREVNSIASRDTASKISQTHEVVHGDRALVRPVRIHNPHSEIGAACTLHRPCRAVRTLPGSDDVHGKSNH